ncbi:hypothetical protein ACJJTC_006288 [Scirpophaga incertulas]
MGKRKRSDRSDSDVVDKVFKKLKRLMKTRTRRISSSDSEEKTEETKPSSPLYSPSNQSNHRYWDIQASDQAIPDEILPEAPVEEPASDQGTELDPDILQLLGSDPTQEKSFRENLHKDLATRWKHILTNGLPKDEKVELLKQYLPAENCTYMKPPVLNPEIKSALSDINVKRDSYSEQKQYQMSSCLSAIGKALNLALTQIDISPEIVKTLSDAGRILCDTHHRESLSRRFAIVNSISKHKREVIKNTKIDEHLFGSNLSEHLKSSKAISMSASELRFNNGKSNQLRSQPSTSTRNRGTLNARGTPRATAAETRVYPGQYRHPPPPPPPMAMAPRAPAPPREYRRAPPATISHRARSYPQTRRR